MGTPKESASCIPSEKNTLLIGEVKKFPSLYDTSDPNYYVLGVRNKAWLKVAERCDEPADLCHLRWKSLRKRYAKEKRRFPEILQGKRRPWALFPKMSFLTISNPNARMRPIKNRRRPDPKTLTATSTQFKPVCSDDDMLIVDDNDEIVHTCKSTEMSEEDEYIYETLDDPDSALEIMKGRPPPKVKPTAIRSGGSAAVTSTMRSTDNNRSTLTTHHTTSGRIRKLTPKMQNSILAKKLKQAQQILKQSNVPSNSLSKKNTSVQKDLIKKLDCNKTPDLKNINAEKTVLYQDQTTRHIATVNPNIIRVEKINCKNASTSGTQLGTPTKLSGITELEPNEGNRSFKVVKLKGRNPIIFSPEQLPDIKSFLKSEGSSNPEQSGEVKSPMLKVKSVDNLNKQNTSPSHNENGENNNLDIIHSVGLMRKTEDKSTKTNKIPHQSYSRAYSWNRPTEKLNSKQATEKIQPDSQTKDYEIEETWNDIKQENIDDTYWPQLNETNNRQDEDAMSNTQDRTNSWTRVNEAKLELVAFQRKLLEEQHKKNMEYMKKEHELKMTLLKAEIDLKRKQLNIML